MSKSAIVLAAVALLAGGAIGWILASDGERPAEGVPPARSAAADAAGRETTPEARLAGSTTTPASNAERIARLEEEVARLRKALAEGRPEAALDPEVRKVEVLERLKSIEHGERQVAVHELVRDLAEIGDPVVADLVDLLRSGYERDWGGGFSTGGNAVKSYGRLRMALIDALRQIGTEESKAGLLSVVGESEDLTDFRDLLLMYGSTRDPVMIEGISALVPGILERIAKEGVARCEQRYVMLIDLLIRWIRRHDMAHVAKPVAAIVERSSAEGYNENRLFGLVVELAPERAAAIAAARFEAHPGRASGYRLADFGDRGQIPLQQVTRYFELLFIALDLDASQRGSLYLAIQPFLCGRIQDVDARIRDARVLLGWMEARRELESADNAMRNLDRAIKGLESAIDRLTPK